MKDNNSNNLSTAQPDGGRQTQRLRRSRDTLIAGGVFGTVLVVVCCLAPLVLVAFGIGAAWVVFFTDLERYLLPMLAVAAVCFVGGVWFNRKVVQASCADETCFVEPPRRASPPKQHR